MLAALGGAATYFAFAGKPDHKVLTIAAIVGVFSGLLFTVVHDLRRVNYAAKPVNSTPIRDSEPVSHQPSKLKLHRTLALFPRIQLFAAVALMILLAVLVSAGPLRSKGVWVFLTQQLLAKEHLDPAGPVVVILKAPRKTDIHATTRIFVNESEIDRRNLRGALLSELSRRADWVVFIDADPSLSYSDAVEVVDVVTQLSAKPVLLSRKATSMRETPKEGHDSQHSPSQRPVIFRTIGNHY